MVLSPTTSGAGGAITTELNDKGSPMAHGELLGLFGGSCGSTFKFGASAPLLLLSSSLPPAAGGVLETPGESCFGGVI